ncbi:hypothetical protein GO496_10225 [Acidovorax citrulli]|nr:hypothetical protein [Paracidovorax citrulli]
MHLLLCVNAALALVLLWMWVSPDGTLRNVRWQSPEPRRSDVGGLMPVLPTVGTADTRAFVAMLDRPLFSVSRRPPPPPPPPSASEPPPDNLSSARLSGVYSGGGEGGVIIQVAGKQHRLRMNDNIDGWVLKSIQDRVVSFSRGGETRTLLLPRAAVTVYSGAPLPSPGSNVGQPPVAPPSAGAANSPRRAVFGGSRAR